MRSCSKYLFLSVPLPQTCPSWRLQRCASGLGGDGIWKASVPTGATRLHAGAQVRGSVSHGESWGFVCLIRNKYHYHQKAQIESPKTVSFRNMSNMRSVLALCRVLMLPMLHGDPERLTTSPVHALRQVLKKPLDRGVATVVFWGATGCLIDCLVKVDCFLVGLLLVWFDLLFGLFGLAFVVAAVVLLI